MVKKKKSVGGSGLKTNNQPEILSLWKPCQIASKEKPNEILIIGYSELLARVN